MVSATEPALENESSLDGSIDNSDPNKWDLDFDGGGDDKTQFQKFLDRDPSLPIRPRISLQRLIQEGYGTYPYHLCGESMKRDPLGFSEEFSRDFRLADNYFAKAVLGMGKEDIQQDRFYLNGLQHTHSYWGESLREDGVPEREVVWQSLVLYTRDRMAQTENVLGILLDATETEDFEIFLRHSKPVVELFQMYNDEGNIDRSLFERIQTVTTSFFAKLNRISHEKQVFDTNSKLIPKNLDHEYSDAAGHLLQYASRDTQKWLINNPISLVTSVAMYFLFNRNFSPAFSSRTEDQSHLIMQRTFLSLDLVVPDFPITFDQLEDLFRSGNEELIDQTVLLVADDIAKLIGFSNWGNFNSPAQRDYSIFGKRRKLLKFAEIERRLSK